MTARNNVNVGSQHGKSQTTHDGGWTKEVLKKLTPQNEADRHLLQLQRDSEVAALTGMENQGE